VVKTQYPLYKRLGGCQGHFGWVQKLWLPLRFENCPKDKKSYFNEQSGADPGLVGPEAYTIFGILLKKKNTKLQIQN
jgi:hypothetical protein